MSVLKLPDDGVLVCGSYSLTQVIDSSGNIRISWLPDFPARRDLVYHLFCSLAYYRPQDFTSKFCIKSITSVWSSLPVKDRLHPQQEFKHVSNCLAAHRLEL